MLNFLSTFRKSPRLFISSLVIALPLIINSSVFAQKTSSPEPILSPSRDVATDPIIQKLLGTWEIQNSPVPLKLFFIFASVDKLYLVVNDGKSLEAYPVDYKINSTPRPLHIDMSALDNKEKIATIFEFTDNGQLRLEFINLGNGEPRPKDFTPTASLFKKTSNSTKLPANAKIITAVEREARRQQNESETNVSTLNRYQQAYYLEYGKFAKTFEQLQIPLKSESDFYRYGIVTQGSQSIIHTATAKKPGLKSYTGFVFARKVQGKINTYAIICQTNQPSMKPPAAPKIPKNISQKAQCPVGSSLVE